MADPLEFDEATHTYTCGGLVVPGVTTVLKELKEYASVPAHILDAAAALGTAVHRATELDDIGQLDNSSVHPKVAPYLDAWRRFRHERGWPVESMEERVFSRQKWYAGTFDRVMHVAGERALIDIKTTRQIMGSVGPQLAAYQEAKNYRQKDEVTRRFGVQLKDDSTYQVHEYTSNNDIKVFDACLTLFNWRIKNGQ